MEQTYQYEALPSAAHIRLLSLRPGRDKDSLEVELEHHDLDILPSYEAISYVWGNLTQLESIRCSGFNTQITRTLASALRKLRQLDMPRLLWADALCINQADVIERNVQVRLMQSIYQKCSRVLVWLGDGEQVFEANKMIDKIADTACMNAKVQHEDLASIEDLDYIADQAPRDDFPSADSPRWDSLIWFFSKSYFQRTWIVQEVTAASRILAICGTMELSWDKIGLVANWIHRQLVTSDFTDLQRFEQTNVFEAAMLYDRHYLYDSNFVELLEQFRGLRATDPRDKVFAFAGLPPFTRLEEPLLPDYSLSVSQVYTEAATRFIETQQDLSILSFAHHVTSIDMEWPSWLPKWNVHLDLANFYSSSPYHATQASDKVGLADYPYRIIHNALFVHGVVFDDINNVGQLMNVDHFRLHTDHAPAAETAIHPIKDFWSRHLDGFQGYGKDESVITTVDRLCVSLTAAQDHQNRRVDSTATSESDVIEQYLADFAAYMLAFAPQNEALLEMSYAFEHPYPGCARRYEIAASRVCDQRRLFTSTKGYIGLGPEVMEPKDLICILFGGQTPFVLRKLGDYYIFIGECFIQNLMEGQGLRSFEDGEQTSSAFTIL